MRAGAPRTATAAGGVQSRRIEELGMLNVASDVAVARAAPGCSRR
jgi:hypothetical protein